MEETYKVFLSFFSLCNFPGQALLFSTFPLDFPQLRQNPTFFLFFYGKIWISRQAVL